MGSSLGRPHIRAKGRTKECRVRWEISPWQAAVLSAVLPLAFLRRILEILPRPAAALSAAPAHEVDEEEEMVVTVFSCSPTRMCSSGGKRCEGGGARRSLFPEIQPWGSDADEDTVEEEESCTAPSAASGLLEEDNCLAQRNADGRRHPPMPAQDEAEELPEEPLASVMGVPSPPDGRCTGKATEEVAEEDIRTDMAANRDRNSNPPSSLLRSISQGGPGATSLLAQQSSSGVLGSTSVRSLRRITSFQPEVGEVMEEERRADYAAAAILKHVLSISSSACNATARLQRCSNSGLGMGLRFQGLKGPGSIGSTSRSRTLADLPTGLFAYPPYR